MLPPSLLLKPSRWILLWLGLIHVFAAAAVMLSTLPASMEISLVLLVFVSLMITVNGELRRRDEELVPVTLTEWRIRSINGTEQAELIDVRVFRHVVMLRFRSSLRRWSGWRAIAEDAVPNDVHRRLRAALTVLPIRGEADD